MFCLWRQLVCVENFSIQTMTFTLIWVSSSLHRQRFSPKSGFKKRLSPQTMVLVLNLISQKSSLHRQFLYCYVQVSVMQFLESPKKPYKCQVFFGGIVSHFLGFSGNFFFEIIRQFFLSHAYCGYNGLKRRGPNFIVGLFVLSRVKQPRSVY